MEVQTEESLPTPGTPKPVGKRFLEIVRKGTA
jgi:hypothetical protein